MTTHFNKWRMVVSKSIFLYFYGLFEERFSGTTNNRKEKKCYHLALSPFQKQDVMIRNLRFTATIQNVNLNLWTTTKQGH